MTDLIHGTSGAEIVMGGRAVLKIAPKGGEDRVRTQAAFMQRVGLPFARVLRTWPDRYAMERLRETDAAIDPTPRLCAALLSLAPVWGLPAELSAGWAPRHWNYVSKLLDLHKLNFLRVPLYELFSVVVNETGPVCQIHGDCTLDNLMEKDGEPRWIDPIPASDVIPPLLAVDWGKLMQSASGYEDVKYERPVRNVTRELMSALMETNPDMALQTAYFQFVHVLRLLRYAVPHVKNYYLREIHRGKDVFLL